jgi:peptidoglycan/LPS O-acetylase OafA/YrhL
VVARGKTIGEALAANGGVGPGFHFLRHALSFAIVLLHCRTASHWTASAAQIAAGERQAYQVDGPLTFSLNDLLRPGVVALVAVFFALSGFLVTGSAIRTQRVPVFFANRALRILPALSVEVTLSALILGPIFTTLALGDYFSDPMLFRYFGNIFGFVTFDLPGVFEHLPWTRNVNGSLWTLPAEFWCYALMMLALWFKLLRRPQVLLGLVLAVVAVTTIGNLLRPDIFVVRGPNFVLPWYIVFMFWVGSVFYLYADRIPLKASYAVLAAVLYYCAVLFNVLVPLAALPLAYCMAYAGMVAVPLWDRMVKSDYSYGIYLYAFPIMQAWIALLLPWSVGWSPNGYLAVLFTLTLVATTLFAALSWHHIEKPALALRKVFLPTLPGSESKREEAPKMG